MLFKNSCHITNRLRSYLGSEWRTSCTLIRSGTCWRWGLAEDWRADQEGWKGPGQRSGRARGRNPRCTDLCPCYWGQCTNRSPADPDTARTFCIQNSSPLKWNTTQHQVIKKVFIFLNSLTVKNKNCFKNDSVLEGTNKAISISTIWALNSRHTQKIVLIYE